MKYFILSSLLLVAACSKPDDKACYSCTKRQAVADGVNGNNNFYNPKDTTICDKTEEEINLIIIKQPQSNGVYDSVIVVGGCVKQ